MKFFAYPVIAALATCSVAVHADEFSVFGPTVRPGARLAETHVFNGSGCNGRNRSPALTWKNPPMETKSFAVTMYDPDAPTGSGWWHWVVYNIPASTHGLLEGVGSADGRQLPRGAVQGHTDFGIVGYGGACPPAGDKHHRYIITIHALKVEHLDLPPDASAAMVGFMLNANRLGIATLQASYSR